VVRSDNARGSEWVGRPAAKLRDQVGVDRGTGGGVVFANHPPDARGLGSVLLAWVKKICAPLAMAQSVAIQRRNVKRARRSGLRSTCKTPPPYALEMIWLVEAY